MTDIWCDQIHWALATTKICGAVICTVPAVQSAHEPTSRRSGTNAAACTTCAQFGNAFPGPGTGPSWVHTLRFYSKLDRFKTQRQTASRARSQWWDQNHSRVKVRTEDRLDRKQLSKRKNAHIKSITPQPQLGRRRLDEPLSASAWQWWTPPTLDRCRKWPSHRAV